MITRAFSYHRIYVEWGMQTMDNIQKKYFLMLLNTLFNAVEKNNVIFSSIKKIKQYRACQCYQHVV
jgi:hypothetical protein